MIRRAFTEFLSASLILCLLPFLVNGLDILKKAHEEYATDFLGMDYPNLIFVYPEQ